MDSADKTRKAEKLASDLAGYGAAAIESVLAVSDENPPHVRVRMRDGLSFVLPYDFNAEHLDTVMAVIAISKIKGREEALLDLVGTDTKPH